MALILAVNFKSPYAGGDDSWLSASPPLDALSHPCSRREHYGWLAATCYLIFAFYLKRFFPSANRVFPSGCLSVRLRSIKRHMSVTVGGKPLRGTKSLMVVVKLTYLVCYTGIGTPSIYFLHAM